MPKVLAWCKMDRLREERSHISVKDCELGSRLRAPEGQTKSDRLKSGTVWANSLGFAENARNVGWRLRSKTGAKRGRKRGRMPARAPVTKPAAERRSSERAKDTGFRARIGGSTANGVRHRTPSASWKGWKTGLPERHPRQDAHASVRVGSAAMPAPFALRTPLSDPGPLPINVAPLRQSAALTRRCVLPAIGLACASGVCRWSG